MIDWILNLYHAHTHPILLVAYVLPALTNLVIFTVRTIEEYRDDLKRRADADKAVPHTIYASYTPRLTLGHLVGRFLGTILPFVNVICCIGNLDGVFELMGRFFSWIYRVLDIPLVPNRKK